MNKYLLTLFSLASIISGSEETDQMAKEAANEAKKGGVEAGKCVVEGTLAYKAFMHGKVREGVVVSGMAVHAGYEAGKHLYRANKIEGKKCEKFADEYKAKKKGAK